jgi:hypothetical protein
MELTRHAGGACHCGLLRQSQAEGSQGWLENAVRPQDPPEPFGAAQTSEIEIGQSVSRLAVRKVCFPLSLLFPSLAPRPVAGRRGASEVGTLFLRLPSCHPLGLSGQSKGQGCRHLGVSLGLMLFLIPQTLWRESLAI